MGCSSGTREQCQTIGARQRHEAIFRKAAWVSAVQVVGLCFWGRRFRPVAEAELQPGETVGWVFPWYHRTGPMRMRRE
jgi:hypothetical protein